MDVNEKFINKCKELVADYTNQIDTTDKTNPLKPEDVFVSWSSKTLQNNKALLGTPISNGMYYEVTHNGDKNELYFVSYKKVENIKHDFKA